MRARRLHVAPVVTARARARARAQVRAQVRAQARALLRKRQKGWALDF